MVIFATDTGAEVATLPQLKVTALSWSPGKKYLLAWNRWVSGEMNLHVWALASPEVPLISFSQKEIPNKMSWPSVQWTADEVDSSPPITAATTLEWETRSMVRVCAPSCRADRAVAASGRRRAYRHQRGALLSRGLLHRCALWC